MIIDPTDGTWHSLAPVGMPQVGTFCSLRSPDGTTFACQGGNDSDTSVNGIYTIRSSDGGGVRFVGRLVGWDDGGRREYSVNPLTCGDDYRTAPPAAHRRRWASFISRSTEQPCDDRQFHVSLQRSRDGTVDLRLFRGLTEGRLVDAGHPSLNLDVRLRDPRTGMNVTVVDVERSVGGVPCLARMFDSAIE